MGSLDKYTNKSSPAPPNKSIDEQLRVLEEKVRLSELEAKRMREQNQIDEQRRKEQSNRRQQTYNPMYDNSRPSSKREQRVREREQRMFVREQRRLKRKGIDYKEYDNPTTETETDDESNRILLEKYRQRHPNMRKSERKLIEGMEDEGNRSRQSSIVYLAVIGLGFISFLYFYLKIDWMSMILLYVGLMMFLPVGMIVGWVFLDPYMRCKTLRRMTHKNYGIVNFVGKGQKIASKIKNFDDALIWRGNSVWAITREHIYQLSKNGDYLTKAGKIDPESVVTLVETVPVLFVDLDSMQPFSLARDRREGINPLELGSALKSWVDNEKAKALGIKKSMDILLIIVIICSVVAVGLAYMNMTNVEDMMTQITSLKGTVDSLVQQLNHTGIVP